MPEKNEQGSSKIKMTESNINNSENDCEKVKSLADEYLHGELPELSEEKKFIETHIIDCKECLCYIAEEKIYLEEIKLAEYVPEISVSQSVMDTITKNKMIVGKPPKRRFIPVGFVSAAAVVIIMFAISRGGPLNIFMKTSQNNSNAESDLGNNMDIAMYAGEAEDNAYNDGEIAEAIIADEAADGNDYNVNANAEAFQLSNAADADKTVVSGGADLNYSESVGEAVTESGIILREAAPAALGIETPPVATEAITPKIGFYESATDELYAENEDIDGGEAEIAEETSAAEEAPVLYIPAPVEESRYGSEMDEYIPEISGMEINEFYEFYYIGSNQTDFAEKKLNIFKDIEIYKHDDTRDVVDIIDKKYKDTLERNLIENNIAIGEILSKYQDGEYIAVIYWFN